jgi:hypothetical protein
MKKQFAVKTRFTFTGTFFVAADNRAQAAEYVEKHCGLALGGTIHSSLPCEEVDWEFAVHPRTSVGKVTVRRNRRRV